jgi:hypothetical protein
MGFRKKLDIKEVQKGGRSKRRRRSLRLSVDVYIEERINLRSSTLEAGAKRPPKRSRRRIRKREIIQKHEAYRKPEKLCRFVAR